MKRDGEAGRLIWFNSWGVTSGERVSKPTVIVFLILKMRREFPF